MKNKNEWFKFEFRTWLEDERVMRMSMAAQGLYIRHLCYQARHGSLPHSVPELSLVLMAPNESQETWESVHSHFSIDCDGAEERLYNKKLRDILVFRDEISKSKSYNRKNKCKTNDKQKKNVCLSKGALRASLSNSLSLSSILEDRFNNFWLIYPRKQQKQTALASWKTHVPDAELADKIIAHVSDRSVKDHDWIKEDGKFVPFPATFLNQHRWEDQYSTAKPQNHAKSFKSQDDKVQEHHARVMKHDPVKAGRLTQEEIEEDAGMEILF